MRKSIVITSIFPPSQAVKAFARQDGWNLIVVGDRKSPHDWQWKNVTYLSPTRQTQLGYRLTKRLPWNHYGRKMIGYLYAMEHGAEIIADSDDDNVPNSNWALPKFAGPFPTIKHEGFTNVYSYFGGQHIWPRGYPLNQILERRVPHSIGTRHHKVGIWQYLADGDPDVDAIYRLTSNRPFFFRSKKPIVLTPGTICPINSQNTFFTAATFPLLYLPAFVTFRFTDILRGLVAQPLLWSQGLRAGFGPASVTQERNPHDYLKDFISEIPIYQHTEEVIELTKQATTRKGTLHQNLLRVYQLLNANGIVSTDELVLLKLWLADVAHLQRSVR